MMLRDFRLLNLSRLSLGTAQFGMKYGINNRFGKIKIHEAKNILNYCEKLGIRSIDSAISYGDAEKILEKLELKILRLPQNYLLLRLRKLKI